VSSSATVELDPRAGDEIARLAARPQTGDVLIVGFCQGFQTPSAIISDYFLHHTEMLIFARIVTVAIAKFLRRSLDASKLHNCKMCDISQTI
jgi:hypothetical protein